MPKPPEGSNPWLNLPLQDYEGHMSAPEVDQLRVLSEVFAAVLAESQPASVAIAGIAGGNGLEHINPAITHRILGIDINPAYLSAVKDRHPGLRGLELIHADLSQHPIAAAPCALVYAALVLEHVSREHAGLAAALENLRNLVAANGTLAIVLQLPSAAAPGVAKTAYPAMQSLAGHFAFVDKEALQQSLQSMGMRLARQETRQLQAGKSLWIGIFR